MRIPAKKKYRVRLFVKGKRAKKRYFPNLKTAQIYVRGAIDAHGRSRTDFEIDGPSRSTV